MKGSGKMFETGEYVVYGRTGICQVTGVTTMRVDGSSGEKLYYVLRPGGETDGKIFICPKLHHGYVRTRISISLLFLLHIIRNQLHKHSLLIIGNQ